MTESEWLEVVAELRDRWPQSPMSEGTIEAWYSDVADLEVEAVRDAMASYSRDGREFAPHGGLLRLRALALSQPTRDWAQGYKLANACPHSFIGEPPDDSEVALAWLAERDPVAAEAVRCFGVREFGLRQIADEGTNRAQFRQIYESVAKRADEAERYAGLPTYERTQVGSGEPRRLSAVAALPARTGLQHEESKKAREGHEREEASWRPE